MRHSGFFSPVRYVGAMIVLAAIAVGGCQRNAEPAASAPEGQSAEYPMPAPAIDSQTIPAVAIKVSVSLSPAVAGKAAPGDTVFVFARAAHGPRMPLAIVRKQVKDLPATIVLDDSTAMNPDIKLSGVPEVVVVARVSKSGTAYAKPGDLEGVSAPVKLGQSFSLSIGKVVTAP